MLSKPQGIVLPPTIASYLKKFGFSKWRVELSQNKLFENIVVIPAIQEYENLRDLLRSIINTNPAYYNSTMFLFVINNVVSTTQEIINDNNLSLQLLQSIIKKEIIDELSKSIIESKINIGLIDAASVGNEMPDKDGGVGFARKIGMDLALNYYDYSSTQKRILICLDADCVIQENYLEAIIQEFNNRNLSAGYVEYEHRLGENIDENIAVITYEIFLRYYVLGLKHANSPYAFDTVGSTMLCDVESYVRIGGMNKRKAAEDFYFMEKLAKITKIHKISSTKIFPSARRSWRVPFGTGQRMNRFFAGTHDEYSLISPKCFEILKQWLMVFMREGILNSEEYLAEAKIIDNSLAGFLIEQKFKEAWNKILIETKKKDQLEKQKYFWFDAFRTMKLLHYLRDTSIPAINMFDALDQMFSNYQIMLGRSEPIPPFSVQLEYLNTLKKVS